MTSDRFRFDSEENWELLGNYSYIAQPIPNKEGQKYPIGFKTLPLTLTNHNIAIRCSSSPPVLLGRYWALTYYLIEDLISPDSTGEFNKTKSFKAWVGETTIMSFPVWASNYKIGIQVPYWYDDFFISVYEYTGPILSTTNDKLDLLIQRLI